MVVSSISVSFCSPVFSTLIATWFTNCIALLILCPKNKYIANTIAITINKIMITIKSFSKNFQENLAEIINSIYPTKGKVSVEEKHYTEEGPKKGKGFGLFRKK